MNRWFRMYDSVLDDPKVQRISPKMFRNWVNLLCLASRNSGQFPAISSIAFGLRCSEVEAQAILDSMLAVGLVDNENGTLAPHKWSERQFQSDNSTERVKRFRQRSRNDAETASATPPETEQIQNRTDKSAPSALSSFEDDFEAWWKIYPKKADRGHAFKTFCSIRKQGVSVEALTAGASKYRADPARKPEYTKNGATWLRGECWRDQAAEGAQSSTRTTDEIEAHRLDAIAEAITLGINVRSASAGDARKLIAMGRLTEDQCRRAGCAV